MKKVLVVDDNRDILHLVSVLLKRNGFIVYTYFAGLNVTDAVADYKPDLILLDINLPGKSGLEICKEIKQASTTPVVLFSAHADKLKSFEECKADAFVQKPFEISNLIETINHHINQMASHL